MEQRLRYTIDIDPEHRARLSEIAKEFKLTQGEVIAALLDNMDLGALMNHLQARRQEKVAQRAAQKKIYQKLKELSPEQLEVALAAGRAQ